MWKVLAEEDMPCTECKHGIGAGTKCLSQMPTEMPEHFRRAKYENFCIKCPECDDVAIEPCYSRYLANWHTGNERERVKVTTEEASCSRCDQAIPERTWVVVQKVYTWPELEDETVTDQPAGGFGRGAGTAGSAVAGTARRTHSGAWHNLSPATQRLFRTRGLGRELGLRSPSMAQRFYERSIPEAIRRQGESAVLRFIGGKDASHIRSVSKMPGWAKRPSNAVWEFAKKNRSRGSKNMSSADLAAAKSVAHNSAIKATAKGAARGGIFSALIEAPIASLENYLHWKRGRKSGRQAATDAAKSTAGAGAVGVAATAATAALPAMAPAVAVSLAAAGVGLMVGSTAHRLYRAARHEMPLDEYCLIFCSRSCRIEYARYVTYPDRSSTWWQATVRAIVTARR